MKQHIEYSLERILEKNKCCDVGFITAFHENYKTSQNIKRNESLRCKLISAGYSIITMTSDYTVKYESNKSSRSKVLSGKGQDNHPSCLFKDRELKGYLVINKKSYDLRAELLRLAVLFEQERMLFIAKGLKASWVSTNPLSASYLQSGTTNQLPLLTIEPKGESINFNIIDGEVCNPSELSIRSRQAYSVIAKQHWSELVHLS